MFWASEINLFHLSFLFFLLPILLSFIFISSISEILKEIQGNILTTYKYPQDI